MCSINLTFFSEDYCNFFVASYKCLFFFPSMYLFYIFHLYRMVGIHSNQHFVQAHTLTNCHSNPFLLYLSHSLSWWIHHLISWLKPHILILSSHYGSYYSTIYSPSTISFVFSVIRILLLAERNKKNFIRLQIGHLFSINLQLWQGRDLFFSVSQSYLINSKYMGTLLFQLSLIGKPKKQPYKIHIKVKDFVNYWNIEIGELLWCINKFFCYVAAARTSYLLSKTYHKVNWHLQKAWNFIFIFQVQRHNA